MIAVWIAEECHLVVMFLIRALNHVSKGLSAPVSPDILVIGAKRTSTNAVAVHVPEGTVLRALVTILYRWIILIVSVCQAGPVIVATKT